MKSLYNVGIYCRLSVDDASNSAKKGYMPGEDSVSIENQRELLSKFVMINGWVETKTYIDDGYSGGNFQRPGFLEMLEDARKGIINLILVKDLSRLGRDFVEVGRYTDIVFPSLGCRFVSVLDCLDSEGDNTDMLHFRSLMNDYHLRDISSKIRSVLHSKKVSGQFTSSYAPYGYRKSDEDKHKLVIDEPAAKVVQRIFEMRKNGMAYGRIAAALNREGILPPRMYWNQQHDKHGSNTYGVWTYATVKSMLRNEVYCGTLVMNHSGSRSYKDHASINKPESEWIRHEDMHDAIIPAEVWDAVQQVNQQARDRAVGSQPPEPKLFSHKLICADCGHTLLANTYSSRKDSGKRFVSYRCGLFFRTGGASCSVHSISESKLKTIVIGEIKAHAQAITMDEASVVEQLKRRLTHLDEQRVSLVEQESRLLRRRVEELESMTAKLYEDKISGAITVRSFAMLMQKNEQERIEKEAQLEALQAEIQKVNESAAAIKDWTKLIRNYLDLQDLDRTTIDELIDHIEVGEHYMVDGKRYQDVKVHYRFVGMVK